MKELGYYNGRIGELSEMTVPMNDRASWFGDGVYDAGLCRNRQIFVLDEHVDRLFRSASMLDIAPPLSKEELKTLLCDLVKLPESGDLFVYYQITRGGGKRTHAFPEGKANLWVTLTPREADVDKTPVSLVTAEDTRFLHCNIKTLNLIPSVMAAEKAKRAGAYECVLYRAPDRVTEAAHSNVHILKDGELFTAPTDNLILPGIVRAHLIRACERLGIPVRETPFTLEDLRTADEIFTTSSGNFLKRACRVDGVPAGMKQKELFEAIWKELFDEFFEATGGI
ncbi:MAG: aminotransferase class IV [Clostridia bacterium]|nr:aminotransferase class IV [Clostridia bacterium]